MTFQNRLSFNVDAKGVNRDHLYAHLNRCTVPPRGILIMDSLEVAVNCYNILQSRGVADPLVVLRDYHPKDGFEWHDRTAEDVVNHWIGQGYPHIIRYDCNEPGFDAKHTPQQHLEWMIEILHRAGQAGIRVASGNLGTGRYEPRDIDAGLYDAWSDTLNEWRHLHFRALHRYAFGVIFAGDSGRPAEALLHRDLWQDENWPAPEGYQDKRLFHESRWVMPGYFWTQRYRWLNIRDRERGYEPLPTIFTEYGPTDDLTDVDSEVKAILNAQFRMPEYPNLRGPRSFAKYWTDHEKGLWPHKTFEQALYDQLRWDNEATADNVLLNCLFTMGQWEKFGFDLERNPEFLRMLEEQPIVYRVDMKPTPEPELPPVVIPPEPVPLPGDALSLEGCFALLILLAFAFGVLILISGAQ